MTINGPAVPIFAMMVVSAERQGFDPKQLDGTLQTDIFKEYIAQKEWIFPPEPHLRLIGDLMEYTDENMPRYKPLSVSGYHIREAGATAAQELAFTLADGFGYVGWASPEVSTSTSLHPVCRSSLMRIWTSSRKSPSSGLHVGFGLGGCEMSTAQQVRRPSGCASTPRPPGCR